MCTNISLKSSTYRNIFLLLFLTLCTVSGRSPSWNYDREFPPDNVQGKEGKPELYNIISSKSKNVVFGGEDTSKTSLSKEEMEMIKERVLDGLGLESIPSRNLTNISKEEFDAAYKDYQRVLDEENNEDYMEEDTDDTNFKSSYRFYSNKVTHASKGRGRRSTGALKKIIHFHVFIPSSTPNSSNIVSATGKFWKKGTKNINLATAAIPVSFYRLDNIPRGKSKYLNLDERLIETKNISIHGNEWIELDLKESVKVWMKNPELDTGVLIKCDDCGSAGVKFMTGGSNGDFKTGEGKVPRLDVQTEIIGLRRVKRSRKMGKSLRRRGRHSDCHDSTSKKGKRSNKCCRRSMQVRFSDLPQFDFIISPREFDAYYCSGRCPARYNPANEHALLQSFLNLRGRRDIPSPCCAPTELKGLPILHIGNDGKLQTSYWSDVIVTKCECA